MNILIHGTVIGLGGIAHHTREFSKALSKYHNVKIRNFNVDHDVWDGYNGTNVFENIRELEPVHHCMLHEQTLLEDGNLKEFQLSGYDGSFIPDIHIVMTEANHHYHYQNYKYDFVGGSCNIFCNSDLKYNVQEWGHINAVAPLTECSENKPTFECHPSPENVINKLIEILKKI